MNQIKELIRQAKAELNNGTYLNTVSGLAALCPEVPFPNGENTIFHTRERQADSFDYFKSIRKTPSQNAYFHIPFCRSACLYCSYEKVSHPTDALMAQYIAALEWEIGRKQAVLGNNLLPDIFYIGGGTPTVLPVKTIEHLLLILDKVFGLRSNREFTVETTPQAILAADGKAKLDLFKEMGVNRINVGVQSFSGAIAKLNGRKQSKQEIFACFDLLRSVGFDKLNLDLIYGLVGQTPQLWGEDLERAAEISPDSITAFSLRVRPPSLLHSLVERGELQVVSEEELLVMRIMAQQFLPEQGYMEDNSDYFIKSPDKRYLYQPFQPHNINRNLIGFGPSAYSLAGDKQVFNTRSTADYLQLCQENRDPIDFVMELTREDFARKRFAEGLRTVFDDQVFSAEFGCSVYSLFPGLISRLKEPGLIRIEHSEISLTFKGRILHDHVANYIKFAGGITPIAG